MDESGRDEFGSGPRPDWDELRRESLWTRARPVLCLPVQGRPQFLAVFRPPAPAAVELLMWMERARELAKQARMLSGRARPPAIEMAWPSCWSPEPLRDHPWLSIREVPSNPPFHTLSRALSVDPSDSRLQVGRVVAEDPALVLSVGPLECAWEPPGEKSPAAASRVGPLTRGDLVRFLQFVAPAEWMGRLLVERIRSCRGAPTWSSAEALQAIRWAAFHRDGPAPVLAEVAGGLRPERGQAPCRELRDELDEHDLEPFLSHELGPVRARARRLLSPEGPAEDVVDRLRRCVGGRP